MSPTAAPGVAFNYRYSFRLPAGRIAEVQERHAATCEQLGVRRCRITGMLYRVVGENDIEAMLSFSIDPALARRFGRAGVEAVTQAEGMLTESLITGEDVGVQRTSRDLAQMREELRGLEVQLGRGDLPPDERSRIEAEVRELHAQIDNAQNVQADQQEMLATTPMTFNYGSGQFAPGEQRPSLSVALDRAINGFLYGGTLLLVILITLLPWAGAGLIVWFLVAFARRRWFRKPAAATPATPPEAEPASTA